MQKSLEQCKDQLRHLCVLSSVVEVWPANREEPCEALKVTWDGHKPVPHKRLNFVNWCNWAASDHPAFPASRLSIGSSGLKMKDPGYDSALSLSSHMGWTSNFTFLSKLSHFYNKMHGLNKKSSRSIPALNLYQRNSKILNYSCTASCSPCTHGNHIIVVCL